MTVGSNPTSIANQIIQIIGYAEVVLRGIGVRTTSIVIVYWERMQAWAAIWEKAFIGLALRALNSLAYLGDIGCGVNHQSRRVEEAATASIKKL